MMYLSKDFYGRVNILFLVLFFWYIKTIKAGNNIHYGQKLNWIPWRSQKVIVWWKYLKILRKRDCYVLRIFSLVDQTFQTHHVTTHGQKALVDMLQNQSLFVAGEASPWSRRMGRTRAAISSSRTPRRLTLATTPANLRFSRQPPSGCTFSMVSFHAPQAPFFD